MLNHIPSQSTMIELLGQSLFEVWQKLCLVIDEKYEMERLWNTGGKNWAYEYKYRRGGKTLCALYAKSNCVGFMIIFGKNERAKFEAIRDTMRLKHIMMGNGLCLSRQIRLNLMTI